VLEGEALDKALAEIAGLKMSEQRHRYYREAALRGHRRVSVATACALWEALLVSEIPCAKDWVAFVRSKRTAAGGNATVSLDEWLMFLEFATTIDESFSNHNANEAWPSLIDEFVESQRVRTTYVGLRNQGATWSVSSPAPPPPTLIFLL